MGRRLFLVATIFAGMWACTSLEGVSGGGDSSDAGGGAEAADGSQANDAPSVDASGPFCDRHPAALYCNDFDHGAISAIGWGTDGTGVVALDDASVVSPPFALLGTASPSLKTVAAFVRGDTAAVAPAVGVKLSFSMFIAKMSTQGVVAVIGVGANSLQLLAGETYFYTQEQLPTSAIARTTVKSALATKWTRVDLALDLKELQTTLVLDGVEIERAPLKATWDATALSTAEIAVGIRYAAGVDDGGALEVHVDDVLATAL